MEMSQGYAPTPVANWAPTYKLYDVAAVAIATLFGTPVAGAALMASNYRKMGLPGKANTAIGLSVLATAVAVGIGFLLPQSLSTPLGIGLLFGMRVTAQQTQGKMLANHKTLGGLMESRWRAFGLSLIFLVGYLAIIGGGVFAFEYMKSDSNKIAVDGGGDVYYQGSATVQDAQALGKKLKEVGYLGSRPATVILSKEKGTTAVSFVVKEGFWNETGVADSFEVIGREIAQSVGGFPIQVRLMNKEKEVQADFKVGLTMVGAAEVYYLGSATDAEAQALGKGLEKEGYFSGSRVTVLLTKNGNERTLGFVVSDGYWEDSNHVAGFAELVQKVAPAIGGLPVKLRLESTSLEVKKEVVVQ